MKKFNLKTTAFLFLISFLGFSYSTQAQDAVLEGPTTICIFDCPTYYFSVDNNPTLLNYEWVFTGFNGVSTSITTNEPQITLCEDGVYVEDFQYGFEITVSATGINGVIYSTILSVVVLDDVFYDNVIQSNVSDICPAANDPISGGTPVGCQKICSNSTVSYWVDIEPSSFGWSVSGAESYTVDSLSQGITVVWGEPGTGSVSVFFFDQFCQAEASICVDILDDPAAGISTNPSLENGLVTICEGQTIDFENTSTGASTYEWNFGAGSSTETSPSFTYETPGTYTVELIAYNDCLCSDTTSISVEVINAENPNVDCVSTVCAGETVTYTSDATCGTFLWDISGNGTVSDGGGATDNFITINWTDGPIGTIELQVSGCSSGNFCLEPTFVEVPVITDNAPIDGSIKVCKGAIEVYSLPAYESTEYNWAVSSFGVIIGGQGTHEITVQWTNAFYPSQTQVVSVSYDNCYLECGGDATLDVEILPEYYLTGAIEVCENATETYTAINTRTNMSFACDWTISQGGATISTINATTDPAIDWNFGAGYYKLTAVPTNLADFCAESFEMNVRVIASPPPVSSIEGETDICPASTYAYEAISATPENNFRWDINDGGVITTRFGNPITVTWGNSAPYSLTVVQINTGGLPCESDPITLDVQSISGFTITGNTDVCRDQTSSFSTEYYDGIDYSWSINPASAGTIIGDPTLNSIEIIWFEVGGATVDLSACGQAASFLVDVHALPQPVVNPPTDLCPNETASLSTTQVFDAYEWKNEFGITISTSATPDIGPGYYQVSVTNQFGCVGNATFYINANAASVARISTPSPTGFCGVAPDADLYAVNSSAGYSYQWMHDGSPIGVDNPVLNATDFGNYYVQVTDANGCIFPSNSISIDSCGVGGGPGGGASCAFAGSNFDLLGGIACNERSYSDASGVSPIAGTTQWFFDDPGSGNNAATGLNATHLFSHAGFFKVLMLADYIDGAGDTFTCGLIRIDTVLMAADFEMDNSCPGGVADFFDLSTFLPFVNITGWEWDFGDPASGIANVSTAQNPNHTFSSQGIYTVTLMATADNGCISTITRDIEVYPPPAVNFEEPAVSCAASASGFIAEIDNTVTYVSWDFGDPASGAKNTSEIFNAYHLYDNPGTYTVTLFVQSIYGCTNSFSRTITIEPNNLAGDISLSGTLPLCEGDFITLTASPGGISWLWSTGETTESIVVGEEEVYEVTITDGDGCSYAPASVSVEIIPAPESPIRAVEYNDYNQAIAYFYDAYQTCYGEDIFLEVIEDANYSYQWSNGDPGTETEYSEDRGNLLVAGNYEIFVTVTDNTTSCANTMGPFSVIVNPVPQNVQITASNAGLICESTETTFSVVAPDATLTYLWNTGHVGTSMTTAVAGEYYVTATTAFGCEAESNRLEITQGPDISKIPSGCHTRCSPDTICIPAISGISSYQWYFNGAAIAAPEGNIPDLIINESGEYYVEMVSDIGCTLSSDPLTIDLLEGFGTISGNVYSDVNGSGTIDVGDTLVSGVDIQLILGGILTDTDDSDVNGFYAFENILSTDYTLQIDTLTIPSNLQATIVSIDTVLVGCDDMIEINWLLEESDDEITESLTFELCAGEELDYNGQTYSSDTTFSVVYTTSNGLDSTVTVALGFLPEITGDLELFTCTGSTIDYNGQTYNPGDQASLVFTSQSGCDSTINLQISEIFASNNTVNLQACAGESVDYNGTMLSIGDVMDFTYSNAMGCDSTVSVAVNAFPEIELDVLVDESCPNTSTGAVNIAVNAGTAPFMYSLDGSNYQTTADFTGLSSNGYTAFVLDDNGCVEEVDFRVEAMDNLVVNANNQLLPCATLETELEAAVLSGDDGNLVYLWNDGSIMPTMTVNEPGLYSVQIANACESITQNIFVEREIDPNETGIYVPNAFSPNDDGPNDIFMAYPSPDMQFQNYNMAIFDRWGNTLYTGKNMSEGWDGKTRNQKMKPGVYVWRLKATVNVCGKVQEVTKSGEVVLLR